MANKAFRAQARRFCQWRYYRMVVRRVRLSAWLEDQSERRTREAQEIFANTRMVMGIKDGPRHKRW